MDDFKGTPGPWERGGGKNGGGELLVYCNNSLGSAVCDATSHYSVFDKKTRIANLNLMAAAPELLEALQKLRDYAEDVCGVCPDDCHEEHPLMMASSAIAKALGKE
ncbi:MAG: hypothetical protein ACTIMC_12105 [Kluyvera intermedia]